MGNGKAISTSLGIPTIEYKGQHYLLHQSQGNASRFAIPFFLEICKGGMGYDVGFSHEEWKFPGAIGVDLKNNDERLRDAMNLPDMMVDYVASSHMLEHYEGRFQDVIEYWLTRIRKGGQIFLYLPNCDYQKYWAWGNKKHIHYLNPAIMKDYCSHLEGITKFFVTEGYDLNGSFYCVIEK